MEEIGKALKTIFDKLSDFFDIFDLSFFVSGVATTICVLLWMNLRGLNVEYPLSGSIPIIAAILICYISGLISFATGRWIRMGLGGWVKSRLGKRMNRYDAFDENFIRIINAHGLESNLLFKKYLERTEFRGTWRLYVRLWAEIRQDPQFTNSLSFLKRYWVMAATYDGLSITLLIALTLTVESWIGVVATSSIDNHIFGGIALGIQLLMFLACIREADRFVDYQVEEVVATIATNESNNEGTTANKS